MEFIKSIVSFFQYINKRASQSELELYIEKHKPSTGADVERLMREFHNKQMFRNYT
jgi:hypothetical protein